MEIDKEVGNNICWMVIGLESATTVVTATCVHTCNFSNVYII